MKLHAFFFSHPILEAPFSDTERVAHAGQDSVGAFLKCAAHAYLPFADDEEGVSSCSLPDDIFSIFIVCLKGRNNNIKTRH